jgi:uncharacterized protein
MDYLFLILGVIFIIVGLIGCILPVIPGTPISYVGLLLLHFTRFAEFEISTLFWLGLTTLIVLLLDYIVPVWGTKKFGGSKYGTWGSGIGLIIGLFFLPAIGPFGIITVLGGPFLGAFIGEKLGGKNTNIAVKSAFGSFIGFLAGTFMKLVTSLIIAGFFVVELIHYFKN